MNELTSVLNEMRKTRLIFIIAGAVRTLEPNSRLAPSAELSAPRPRRPVSSDSVSRFR